MVILGSGVRCRHRGRLDHRHRELSERGAAITQSIVGVTCSGEHGGAAAAYSSAGILSGVMIDVDKCARPCVVVGRGVASPGVQHARAMSACGMCRCAVRPARWPPPRVCLTDGMRAHTASAWGVLFCVSAACRASHCAGKKSCAYLLGYPPPAQFPSHRGGNPQGVAKVGVTPGGYPGGSFAV